MMNDQTFLITVIERTRHTLSVEADSAGAAVDLISDPNNPRITPVDKTVLDLRIAAVRELSTQESRLSPAQARGAHE
tara:strand:+ start:3524 stop:3754 length:231 start_codon:yes stop_codon:yes gene_type:complete